MSASDDEPTTEELRIRTTERERGERDLAKKADAERAAEQHDRRADKSAYLREKLEERERAEREAEERE